MKLLERFKEKYLKLKIESMHQHDRKKREKHKKIVDMKPSAKRTIVEGMAMKKSTRQVMREEYERRKQNRKEKYNR